MLSQDKVLLLEQVCPTNLPSLIRGLDKEAKAVLFFNLFKGSPFLQRARRINEGRCCMANPLNPSFVLPALLTNSYLYSSCDSGLLKKDTADHS